MTPKISIEVAPQHEAFVRLALAMAEEMEQLALTAPDGQVFDLCEAAVILKGRNLQRQALGEAVGRRVDTAEKGAPIRVCACGRKKENRGLKERHLMSAVGDVVFTRRYWKCTCGSDGTYGADSVLGVEGERYTKTLQKHCCRLAADLSFAGTSEHLEEMLGVQICPETVRKLVQSHGKAMARFQATDTGSDQAFQKAAGDVEFTTDAGKVNTREEGWKDLKIVVISKRLAGEPTTPEHWKKQRLPAPTIVLAFAMIATAQVFRKKWGPRLRRLGVACMGAVHVLADGAGWIWKSAERVLTGCMQTLDFYHACQHLNRCARSIFGEDAPEARDAYKRARALLVGQGWKGVCQWVGELLNDANEMERERRRPATERLLGYFTKHIGRLDYRKRLNAGQAIGSGQVEGEAKTLGLRLKRRGARWKRVNVRPMASLICVRHTCQWESYWAVAA